MSTLKQLKDFVPLDTLTEAGLVKLSQQVEIRHLNPGQYLFREGERDTHTYFLLSGEIRLSASGKGPALSVKSGTDTARHPLSRLKPRRYDGVAASPCQVIAVDDDDLDNLITADQTAAYEVTELDFDDPEWMFRLVAQPAFQRVPSANLAALFARLTPVRVTRGEVVIRQGEPGEYYYLIKAGRARVARNQSGQEVPLAELDVGSGFGEEALLSGELRNATVTMMEDGELMRLAKADFEHILQEPLVQWVSMKEVANLVKAGAGLIDVRMENEYQAGTLSGSLNMPLYLLRLKAGALDPKRKYVLFCQTGRRSCAAAFLLTQRGFDVHVIRGGLNGIQHPLEGSQP